MVLSFSTNPFNNYYAATSKEFISLDKAAKQDFKLENRYALLPGNAAPKSQLMPTKFGACMIGLKVLQLEEFFKSLT